MPADDAAILLRYLRDNSQEAFGELVQRHLNMVYFAALRRLDGRAQLADDVTQLVFSKLAAKAVALRGRSSLAGWLFVTTRYEAARAARSERRRQTREEKAHSMQEIQNQPDITIEWEQLRPVIDEVLDSLGEQERELVLLRFFESNSFPEIADRVGASADAVRFRVDRTLEKMRMRLAKKGFSSTAAILGVVLSSQAGVAAPSGLAASISAAALALPVAGGSAVAGILEIMKTSKVLIAATVVAGAVGIGFSIREHSVASRSIVTVRSLNEQNESLSGQITALTESEARVQRGQSAGRSGNQDLGSGVPSSSVSSATVASARPINPTGRGHPRTINRELSNDPAVRADFAGWITACENVNEGPLFKSLGLTQDQIDSLEALGLQFDFNMGGNVLTLRPEGATVQDVNQSIHNLLGDAGYQQYRAYVETQYVREVASGLAGNLFDSDAPLTSDQAEQLTQILAQYSSAPKGTPPFPGQINWDEALAHAQSILAPQQMATLTNLATVISSQPGLWGGMNPISPGSAGQTSAPPSSFFAAFAVPKK